MKIVYETFEEVADALCDGNSLAHQFAFKHDESHCDGWQQGVRDFARLLDELGTPESANGVALTDGKIAKALETMLSRTATV